MIVLVTAMLPDSLRAAQPIPGVPSTYGASESEEGPPPAEPSPNDIRELMRLLGDEGMQQWLARQATEGPAEDGTAGEADGIALQEWLIARLASVDETANAVAAAWNEPGEALARFAAAWTEQMGEGETLRSVVYVIIFLIIGAGLEWLYWRYAWDLRRRIELAAERGESTSIKGTAIRALLSGFGITLFAAGTIGGFLGFEWSPLVEVAVLTLLFAVVTVRVLNTIAVFALCPRVASLRPLPLETPTARFIYWWMMAGVVVLCTGGLAADAIQEMQLVPEAGIILGSATATLLALMAVIAIWHARARLIRGRHRGVGAADLAPMGGTVLVVAAWLLWLVGASALMWTLVIGASLPIALWCSSRLIRQAFQQAAERKDATLDSDADAAASSPAESDALAAQTPGDADEPDATSESPPPQPRSTGALSRPVLQRFVQFVLIVFAGLLLLDAWGLDVDTLAASPSLAGRVFDAVTDVLVVVLIADLVWVLARTAIDNRLAGYVPPIPGHAPGPDARLATLLPLLRNVLMVVLLLMVTLVTLSSLGVNVGPLLAGAGVIGIAVGFGAQTLVRDIVSGFFFLLNDAFRVGEYIEGGGSPRHGGVHLGALASPSPSAWPGAHRAVRRDEVAHQPQP